jgi:hypothetical protein
MKKLLRARPDGMFGDGLRDRFFAAFSIARPTAPF